ncbi:MAG: DUF4347 domain-containing protein, partial [Rubripirellula sp.]|nr:DUF4347 domain-containing protein [Rubripirellula sp.]
MPTRIKQWWHRWLIAADATKCNGIRAIIATTRHDQPLQLSLLEPRILYSATPLDPSMLAEGQEVATPMPDIAGTEAVSSVLDNLTATTIAQAAPSEIVIIDPTVSDIEQLLDDLDQSDRDIEILILDANQDGIGQITDLLDSKAGITALHIVSHSENGAIKLGDLWLSDSNLNGYAGPIASWQQAFHSDADILFYGCELASSEQGQSLVNAIATLTDADVSASTDETGHASYGGDWVLEYEHGSIEHATIFSEVVQQSWINKLTIHEADGFDDTINSIDGLTTLREALFLATAEGPGATISLLTGTYQLDNGGPDEDFGWEGDLDITTDLTIIGAGIDQTFIDANRIDRIFDIIGNVTVNISNLTLQTGRSVDSDGGAIRNTNGTLKLTNVHITESEAANGGAIFNEGALVLNNVILSANTAHNLGGGIHNSASGVITLTDVTIDSNTTLISGGGLSNAGSTASVSRSTFSNNDATSGSGGGIYNTAANGLDLVNTTLSGNAADKGAAIFTEGHIDITNATIVKNTDSSAVYALTSLGTVNLKNTILVGNTDGNANVLLNSLGYNIEDGSTAFTANIGDQQNATQFSSTLRPLANNGGLTATHALLSGSTAINSGTVDAAPTVDQRNILRDTNPDIGAYEFVSSNGPVAIWKTDGSDVPNISEWDGTNFSTPQTLSSGNNWVIIRAAEATTRNEKIVVGVDGDGIVSGTMWDGNNWESLSLGTIATISEPMWNFDVQYETQSGHAMLVWSNPSSAPQPLSFSTWNGTNWSTIQNIPSGNSSDVDSLKLTASPVDDTISLVFSNTNSDVAILWNGDAWHSEQLLETVPTDNIHDANVIHESQSGDAIVIFGDGDTNLHYKTWDANAWSSTNSIAAPAEVSGIVEWTMMSNDPNSDRAAAIVTTTDNEVWTTVWNGDTWMNTTLLTSNAVASDSPVAAIAFESESGSLIAVYADTDSNKINTVILEQASGSPPVQLPSIVEIPAASIALTPNPSTDELMLGIQDSNGAIGYIFWDGNTWAERNTIETASSIAEYQPYTFLWEAEPPSVSNTDPIITSNGGNSTASIEVEENTTHVTMVTAADTDIPVQNLVFSITGGTEASFFVVNDSSGLLTWQNAPDFEEVADSGFGTVFVVEITVEDGAGGLDLQEITVSVTDVNEAPTDITLDPDNASVAENDDAAIIGNLETVDPDTIDSHTYSVNDNRFEVVGSQLKLKAGQSLDFEAEPTVDLAITATDQNGLGYSDSFIITVGNVNETPTNISLDNTSVAENSDAAIIGNLGVTDPDTADSHTLTVNDNRFEIVGSQLKLKAGQSLDFEAEPTVDLAITATDQNGLGYSDSFIITVGNVNETPT